MDSESTKKFRKVKRMLPEFAKHLVSPSVTTVSGLRICIRYALNRFRNDSQGCELFTQAQEKALELFLNQSQDACLNEIDIRQKSHGRY